VIRLEAKNAGKVSAVIYTGLSLLAGLAFLLVTLLGGYPWVARIGGTLWVFGLMMIVLMPTVTPLVRSRLERRAENL
jgi:type IV secretory pathway TrbD component